MSLPQRECCGYRIALADIASEEQISTKEAHHVVSCTHMQSGDGQLLIAVSNGAIALWDIRARRVLRRYVGGAGLLHVAVPSPGGKYVAAGYESGHIAVWLLDKEKAPAFMCEHSPFRPDVPL